MLTLVFLQHFSHAGSMTKHQAIRRQFSKVYPKYTALFVRLQLFLGKPVAGSSFDLLLFKYPPLTYRTQFSVKPLPWLDGGNPMDAYMSISLNGIDFHNSSVSLKVYGSPHGLSITDSRTVGQSYAANGEVMNEANCLLFQ